MLEIIIERWSNPNGREDFLWSVWQDGKRIEIGGPYPTASAAGTEARDFCGRRLGGEPDRVTHL